MANLHMLDLTMLIVDVMEIPQRQLLELHHQTLFFLSKHMAHMQTQAAIIIMMIIIIPLAGMPMALAKMVIPQMVKLLGIAAGADLVQGAASGCNTGTIIDEIKY
jgi:hypothetical protein